MRYEETTATSQIQQRHRDEIRRIEKERKDLLEQQRQDLLSAKAEQQTFKDKFEQSKTRNTVLNNEVKTLRDQLKTSLEKGKHDDELIEVLLKQQQQTKTAQETKDRDTEMKTKLAVEQEQTLKLEQMRQMNMIKQLQFILDQKETKIRELELHLDENEIKVGEERKVLLGLSFKRVSIAEKKIVWAKTENLFA